MDLHDFRDVAENYDRYLEVMYEHDNHHEHFQEFYLELARKYGSGGIVDVACGTGAVLLYLAERGLDVDGTDISGEMCRVAASKAEDMGLHLNIIPADMTRFSSGRKYSLAIIARSGFMHLPTQQLQEAALRNLHEQLLPGGILTLNTFDPWPPIQAEQMRTTPEDYSFRLEYINSSGNREKIYTAVAYNPYTQQMYGNWKFVEYNDREEIIGERIRPLMMRQTYRSEMFLLARLCGFEVTDIYRGYDGDREDLNDPDSASKYRSNLIWILKKKEPEQSKSTVIREAGRGDLAACAQLIRKSFRTVADEFGFTEENAPRFTAFATTEDRLLWQLEAEHRQMFVCEVDGVLCGYCSLALQEGQECELSNLAVLPEYRHHGIGEKLMEHAADAARKAGCRTMNIGIVEENTVLRKWYEQHGAVHTGTRKFDFFPFTCGYMKMDLTGGKG